MRTSSLILRSSLPLISAFISSANAEWPTTGSKYSLQSEYSGSTFFDGFDFIDTADPTHGFVTYVSKGSAQSKGLISAKDGEPVYIGVDYTHTYNASAPYWDINGVGRPSVRLEGRVNYNHGLFIADILHMPGGVCGTWPALWTLGDGLWPYHGEIDIIEGVHTQQQTVSSAHTAQTCTMPDEAAQLFETGTVQTSNCTFDVPSGNNSAGCGVRDDKNTFGTDFNQANGGVFAMEWTSSYIRMWSWLRDSIPADILAGVPKPSTWGMPYVNFAGGCDIDQNFINHRIVLDTTFCGDWAGNVWADSCQAATRTNSCAIYVADNPSAFKDIYWSINSIKVYQSPDSNSTTNSTTPSNSTSTIASTIVLNTTSTTTSTTASTTTSTTTSTTSSNTGPTTTSTTSSAMPTTHSHAPVPPTVYPRPHAGTTTTSGTRRGPSHAAGSHGPGQQSWQSVGHKRHDEHNHQRFHERRRHVGDERRG